MEEEKTMPSNLNQTECMKIGSLTNTGTNTDAEICLRPHHGMCLAFFEGKGYSEGFTAHMQKILELLAGKDGKDGWNSPIRIRLVTHTDSICTACPNLTDSTFDCVSPAPSQTLPGQADGPNRTCGRCREESRVLAFDQDVLKLCGLTDGEQMAFGAFVQRVQSQILAVNKRQEVCGGCQWEDICANHASRWRDT